MQAENYNKTFMSTIKTALAITWLPNPGAQVDYRAALGELSQIRDDLRTNHPDFLSVCIFRWANSAIQAAYANGNVNPDNAHIARVIHARIDELVQDILVNPLSFNPVTRRNNLLTDPLRERDWVWERGDHEACETLFPLSPLDGGEMLVEPPPHIPAKRMLVWAAGIQGQVPLTLTPREPATSLTTVSGGPNSTLDHRSMQILPRTPMIDQMRRMIYTKLCTAALSQRRDQVFRQNMEDTAARVDQRMTVIHALSSQVIANAQMESRAAEATIRFRLEGIDRAHQEALNGLQHHLSEQNDVHQAETTALEAQIALREQTQTATIHLLDGQITEGNEAQRAATSELQEQIHALNLSHTTQVSSLERQLDRTTEEHATDVTTIRDTESTAVSLDDELTRTRAQLQAASQALATQQTQTAQSGARVQQLESQVNAAMGRAYSR